MSESSFLDSDLETSCSNAATLDNYGQPQVIPNSSQNKEQDEPDPDASAQPEQDEDAAAESEEKVEDKVKDKVEEGDFLTEFLSDQLDHPSGRRSDGLPWPPRPTFQKTGATYGISAFVMENDRIVKKVKNLIFMGDDIPEEVTFRFITSLEEVPLEIYESKSMERIIAPSDAERLNFHALHIRKPIPGGTPVNFKFGVNDLGVIYLSAHAEDEGKSYLEMELIFPH